MGSTRNSLPATYDHLWGVAMRAELDGSAPKLLSCTLLLFLGILGLACSPAGAPSPLASVLPTPITPVSQNGVVAGVVVTSSDPDPKTDRIEDSSTQTDPDPNGSIQNDPSDDPNASSDTSDPSEQIQPNEPNSSEGIPEPNTSNPLTSWLVHRPAVVFTPPRFPYFSASDLDQGLNLTAQVGMAVVILSWDEPNLDQTAQLLMTWSKARGIPMILALSPTAIQPRHQLVVPQELALRVGGKPSFSNQLVRDAFVEQVRKFARLRPWGLCLGTEVNLLAEGAPAEFEDFVTLYAAAYKAAKVVYSKTQIFTSFYWDAAYLRIQNPSSAVPAPREIIDAFRPQLDAFVLSSYPANHWPSPSAIPDNLYTSISDYRGQDESLIMMEIGLPSGGSGSADEQVQFVDRLSELFAGMEIDVLSWSLLHDVPTSLMGEDLATTGLRNSDGTAKPVWDAFLQIQASP